MLLFCNNFNSNKFYLMNLKYLSNLIKFKTNNIILNDIFTPIKLQKQSMKLSG